MEAEMHLALGAILWGKGKPIEAENEYQIGCERLELTFEYIKAQGGEIDDPFMCDSFQTNPEYLAKIRLWPKELTKLMGRFLNKRM